MIRSFLFGLAVALIVIWVISIGWGLILISRSDSVFWGVGSFFIGVVVIRVARLCTPARSRSVAIYGWILGCSALPILGLLIGLIVLATGYIPSECLKAIRHIQYIQCIRM
jgi:riboflavin transporter FmnP